MRQKPNIIGKEECGQCNKRTKYMYKLNHGVFCEKHYKSQLMIQEQSSRFQAFSDMLIIQRESWNNPINIPCDA